MHVQTPETSVQTIPPSDCYTSVNSSMEVPYTLDPCSGLRASGR